MTLTIAIKETTIWVGDNYKEAYAVTEIIEKTLQATKSTARVCLVEEPIEGMPETGNVGDFEYVNGIRQ